MEEILPQKIKLTKIMKRRRMIILLLKVLLRGDFLKKNFFQRITNLYWM